MNRTALGLAIGAGYFLGRTRKLKMAVAVGSLVAGKKLNLSPKMLTELVGQQLKNNPEFKVIGDQLREDLRGVGKAASGAMVERQMNSLADRLHDRTSQVRGELTGALPGTGSDEEPDEDESEARDEDESEAREDEDDEGRGARQGASGGNTARKTAKKAPAKKAPAGKKAADRKTAPAKKAAAKRTGAARKAAAQRTAGAPGAGARKSKGGDDR
ncbi:DNA primase [Streptomyces sp. NPDC004561]